MSLFLGCGETIVLEPGKKRYITSPSYPDPYKLDMECVWLIKTKVVTMCMVIGLHSQIKADLNP